MSNVAKQIKAAVDLGLAPPLKQTGFRKNSTHFSRIDGEALEIVNIQSSQWNSASSARFTLNLGVHFSSVAKALHGTDPMPANPKECYCLLRRRVGMLLPGGADHWWVVTPETNVDALAAELNSAWKDYISPWLEKVKTISGAAPELETGFANPWAAAAARLVLGEHEKTAQLVEAMMERFKTDPDASHPANVDLTAARIKELCQWAASHGLTVPKETTQP